MSGIIVVGRTLMVAAVLAVGSAGCGGNKDSSAPGKTEQVAVSKKYDTFTDDRDGQEYRIAKIGNQTWMAENIRFNVGDSWCYENSADSCKRYGGLYNWNMAKVACPKGWHLPSREEWTELVTVAGSVIGGKKLKATGGWNEFEGKSGNGTDDFGFSAHPGGLRGADSAFDYAGDGGYWWTADEYGSDNVRDDCGDADIGYSAAAEYGGGNAYYRDMLYSSDSVRENFCGKGNGNSVRCVAD